MTLMTYETRTKAVHALRTTTAPQIKYTMCDATGGRCANGVIADALGLELAEDGQPYSELEEEFGIPVSPIFRRNDRLDDPWTFAEIADWLERRPVSDPPVIPAAVPAEWTASKAIAA